MTKLLFLLVSIISVNDVCSYNVLIVFPHPGRSHALLGESYVRSLVNADHEVTYITPILMKSHPKLKQVDVSSHFDAFQKDIKIGDFQTFLTEGNIIKDVRLLYDLLLNVQKRFIDDKNIQTFLMNSDQKYDVAIVQWLYSEINSGFAAVFNIPYIWASSFEPHPAILSLIDEPQNPAYFRDHVSPVVPPLSFLERVSELWGIVKLFFVRWHISDKSQETFTAIFGPSAAKRGITLPKLEEYKYNSSLIFGNSHAIVGEANKLPQNYIPIGGFHIENKVPPLPEKFLKIMNEARDGVIYFSMGTIMNSRSMPQKMKTDLLNAFSELKQTVIWKFEGELTNLPSNVHIVQWAPQQSILAHPNCKLIISHGGLLSISEALYYGVPIIGIPLFADHHVNMLRVVKRGFGIQLDLMDDMPGKLKIAIQEMLSNPTYIEKMKEFSFIYHHRPIKPNEEIVHWVEHVVKTNGARHLRSPALDVPLYQKLYLEFIGLIVTGITIIIMILNKVLSRLKKNEKNIQGKKNK